MDLLQDRLRMINENHKLREFYEIEETPGTEWRNTLNNIEEKDFWGKVVEKEGKAHFMPITNLLRVRCFTR